jgi:hypothetical protein
MNIRFGETNNKETKETNNQGDQGDPDVPHQNFGAERWRIPPPHSRAARPRRRRGLPALAVGALLAAASGAEGQFLAQKISSSGRA